MSDYDEKAKMNSGYENETEEEPTSIEDYINKYRREDGGLYNNTFSSINIYQENQVSLLDDYVKGYTNDLWIVIDQGISIREEFVVNYECFLELFKHLEAIGVDSSSAKGFALDYYLYQFEFHENGRMMTHLRDIYKIREYADSIKDMLAGISDNYDVLKLILESDINRKLFSATGKNLTDLLIELYQFFDYIDAVIVGSIKSLIQSDPETAKFAMDRTDVYVMYGPKRREYDEKCEERRKEIQAKREYDESFEGRVNNAFNNFGEKANKFFGRFKKK